MDYEVKSDVGEYFASSTVSCASGETSGAVRTLPWPLPKREGDYLAWRHA
jgi:hypothetical protein